MSDIKPTMTLVTSHWDGIPSFRMIPAHKDAPYEEVIYVPQAKHLVIFSRFVKQSLHLIPQLDDHGDMVKPKHPRSNGKNYREQRTTIETFPEHYVLVPEEIENFVNTHAVNASDYDYKKFMNAPTPTAEISQPVETPTMSVVTPE